MHRGPEAIAKPQGLACEIGPITRARTVEENEDLRQNVLSRGHDAVRRTAILGWRTGGGGLLYIRWPWKQRREPILGASSTILCTLADFCVYRAANTVFLRTQLDAADGYAANNLDVSEILEVSPIHAFFLSMRALCPAHDLSAQL